MNNILIRFVRALHVALFIFVGILAGDTLARMLLLSWVVTIAAGALLASGVWVIVRNFRAEMRAKRYLAGLRRAVNEGRI